MRIRVADDEFAALTKMMTLFTSVGDCVPAAHGRQAFELFTGAIFKKQPVYMRISSIHKKQV